MRRITGQGAVVFLFSSFLLAGQTISAASNQQPLSSDQQQLSPANSVSDDNSSPATTQSTNHKWHVRLGTVSVAAGYSYIADPFLVDPFFPYYGFFAPGFFYPGYLYGPYAPFYGPYAAYGYPPSFTYADDKGKVELAVLPKIADVYVDGAYAGAAGDLKKIWLSPGAYDLEVSLPGGIPYHQRIYVLSGKSLKIKHNLLPQNVQDKN